jgi:hypothetical protein
MVRRPPLLLLALHLHCLRLHGLLAPAEREALVDVFDALGGHKWRNGTGGSGRWLDGDPCANRWFGVRCDPNGTHVVSLYPSSTGSGSASRGRAMESFRRRFIGYFIRDSPYKVH